MSNRGSLFRSPVSGAAKHQNAAILPHSEPAVDLRLQERWPIGAISYCVGGSVEPINAGQCFSYALTAIAVTLIAVIDAARRAAGNNGARLTAAISRAPKAGLTIAIRQRLHRQRRNCSTEPSDTIFVTDHGSKAATSFGNISGPSSIERYEFLPSAVIMACRVCGRRGLLVNPFEPE
jgi:hypothetical protein